MVKRVRVVSVFLTVIFWKERGMEREELLQKQHRMLSCLSHLPRKMLGLQNVDNITEFVLHDLCNADCFNLNKAAYFVDNPDFNCTKGIAGFSRDEACGEKIIWDEPQEFSNKMKSSAFNNQVRTLSHCSLRNIGDVHESLAREIAQELGFKNHAFCSWHMKHGNEGFVVYEKVSDEEKFADDYMINGLSLLSFCPVF